MSGDAQHGEVVLRLADYGRGRLDTTARAEVAAHVEACEECRGMLEAYSLLASASLDAPDATHLTSAAIAALAVAGPSAGPASDEARHLDSCPECSEDLRLARAANVLEATRGHVLVERSTTWLLPLAAALAIALLGIATVRAWRNAGALSERIAALETDNASLRSQVSDLSRVVAENRVTGEPGAPGDGQAPGGAEAGDEGAVPYLLLHATVRGAGEVPRLVLRPGRPALYVALAIEVPASVRRPGEGGRVALRDASGREVWSTNLGGAAFDDLVARGDALLLRIPTAAVSVGRMEIRVTPAAPDGGKRVWFVSALEVSGSDRSR